MDYHQREQARTQLTSAYGHQCLRCGIVGTDSNPITIDHARPRNFGGADHSSNLQPLCRRCNQAKGGWAIVDHRPRTMYEVRPVPVAASEPIISNHPYRRHWYGKRDGGHHKIVALRLRAAKKEDQYA